MKSHGLSITAIAWAAALIPFVTTHISYLLAAGFVHVEWCMPYWDSCTSISATGRHLPEKIWFKALMIPAALTTALLWWCAAAWCRIEGSHRYPRTLRCMPVLGTLAALFLILYTAALGESGDAYSTMRRIGVTLAFAFSYLSQLMLTRLLGDIGTQRQSQRLMRWYPRLLGLNMLLLAVGISTVILDALIPLLYDEHLEDALEWWMALLLNLYFAFIAIAWRGETARLGVIRPD